MATNQIVYRGNTPPGQSGVPVVSGVRTNLFRIGLPSKNVQFHQYDVSIQLPGGRSNKKSEAAKADPNLKPVPKRYFKPVIDHLQKQSQHASLFNPPGAYDGVASLYIPNSRIADGGTYRFNIDEGEKSADPEANGEFMVRLVRVAIIKHALLNDTIAGIADAEGSIQAINAVNAVIRMAPFEQQSDYELATKRAFFNSDPRAQVNLQGGLVLLKGFYSSVRPRIGALVLNLDTTSLVAYRPGALIGFCLDVLNTNNARDLESQSLGSRHADLMKVLKRVKVSFNANHPLQKRHITAGQSKRHSIIGLTKEGADRYKFSYDDKKNHLVRDVTIQQYYLERYNLRLQFPRLVCVKLKDKMAHDLILPMELLNVPEGQAHKSTLDARAATTMINETKRHPRQRLQEVEEGLQALGYESSQYIRVSGMTLTPQVENPPARLLPHPSIRFGKDKSGKEYTVDVQRGGWDALRKPYKRPARILGWAVVGMDVKYRPRGPEDVMNSFAGPLWETLKLRGLVVPADPLIRLNLNLQGDVGKQLTEIMDQVMKYSIDMATKSGFKPSFPGQLPLGLSNVLIICVLNSPDSFLREKVKTWSEIQAGVATQIVVGAKISRPQKPDSQYLNNLALKINCKMGGSNSSVDNRWFLGPNVQPRTRTMILGADVSHPSPGSDAPSIAALVYNSSPDSMVDYMTATRVQQSRGEIIQDFAGLLDEAFSQHEQALKSLLKNQPPPDGHFLPHRIVLFRDGVSEGEFKTVFTQELGALHNYLREKGVRFRPRITFIVVGKRHHIRFFPAPGGNPQQQDAKNGNLPSGLVVDREVVHPLYRDFYLQSQRPLMGTSRSAHYTVLCDENNMSQDDLQKLAFDLCHVYGRSTNAVSIPAPVYYADLVCARARLHLGSSVFGSEGSLVEEPTNLDPQALAQMNRQIQVHDRQKRRMYFV